MLNFLFDLEEKYPGYKPEEIFFSFNQDFENCDVEIVRKYKRLEEAYEVAYRLQQEEREYKYQYHNKTNSKKLKLVAEIKSLQKQIGNMTIKL